MLAQVRRIPRQVEVRAEEEAGVSERDPPHVRRQENLSPWCLLLRYARGIDLPIKTDTADLRQLLATLAREPGRVFTRAQLLDTVHGVAFESYERAIDAHVKNIRRKLEDDPSAPRYVLTVYGVGYRFAELDE